MQMRRGRPDIGALLFLRVEPGGSDPGGLYRYGVEQILNRLRVVLQGQGNQAAVIAEPGRNRFRHRDLTGKAFDLVLLGARSHDDDTIGAIGQGGYQEIEADLGYLVHFERQHMRRQAAAETRHRLNGGGSMARVVNQHNGALAPGFGEARQQGSQPAQQRFRGRRRISGRPGRTDAVARTAAAAQIGIDGDVVAIRFDGGGRADVQAAGTARHTAARMGAEFFVKIDIAGLFELPHHIGDVQHCLVE